MNENKIFMMYAITLVVIAFNECVCIIGHVGWYVVLATYITPHYALVVNA